MVFAVEVHSVLAFHANQSVDRALIVELAVRLVWEVDLIDGVGVVTNVLPT